MGSHLPGWISLKQPSSYAWPAILSNKLNLDFVNRSLNGSGNFFILYRLLNTIFLKDDIAIILWSHHERDMIHDINGNPIPFTVNSESEILTKAWITVHNDYDVRIRSWYYIYTASLHLKKLNVKHYFLCHESDEEFLKIKPKWCDDITFLDMSFSEFTSKYPRASDLMHPGIEAHEDFALHILKKITNSSLHS